MTVWTEPLSVVLEREEAPAAPLPAPGLWLHSARFDLAWYLGVPLVVLLLYPLAAALVGPKGPQVVYAFSATVTGLPHNALTWWLLLPAASRARYGSGVLWWPMLLTAATLVPVMLFFGTPAYAYPLGVILIVAYFHIVRQHQGLIHLADLRLAQSLTAQAPGQAAPALPDLDDAAEVASHLDDPAPPQAAGLAASAVATSATATGADARAFGKALRWAMGSGALAIALLKLTGPQPSLGLGIVPMVFPFWPAAPWSVALTGLVFAFSLVWALVKLLAWRRKGGAWPVLHGTITLGMTLILAAAYVVPNSAFFLSLALVSAAHNLQYVGFVWTHHRQRAEAEGEDSDPMSRWARQRRWVPYAATMLACGVGVAAVAALLPTFGFVLLVNWFMTSHYFVDGAMWRRKHYPSMGRYAARGLAP